MARSIPEMASKGTAKLTAKAASMAASYGAAKSRMKAAYAAVGFGPTRTGNYNAGVDAGVYHAPDPTKWSTNWQAKMRE